MPATPRRSSVTSVCQSLKAREDEAQLQVIRLRQALEAKQRRLQRAHEDVAKLRAACDDLKAQHEGEFPAVESELAQLREQTRHLQVSASDRWQTARKTQTWLRKAEERSEAQIEEYITRQKLLEQQNLRLRKALAALKSQLFGWKHRRKGLTMPRCEPTPAMTCQEANGTSAAEQTKASATGFFQKQPSLSQPRSGPPRSTRRSVTPPRVEHAQLREDVRLAKEKAKKAQAELAAAQARLLASERRK